MRIIRIQKDRWKRIYSSEQTGRRSKKNRRISNKTTPRKHRNLSKAIIEDLNYKGRYRQKNYSFKNKFKDRE